jgi:hypothetical protein
MAALEPMSSALMRFLVDTDVKTMAHSDLEGTTDTGTLPQTPALLGTGIYPTTAIK